MIYAFVQGAALSMYHQGDRVVHILLSTYCNVCVHSCSVVVVLGCLASLCCLMRQQQVPSVCAEVAGATQPGCLAHDTGVVWVHTLGAGWW